MLAYNNRQQEQKMKLNIKNRLQRRPCQVWEQFLLYLKIPEEIEQKQSLRIYLKVKYYELLRLDYWAINI